MYRAVIADDEQRIINLIRQLIDWEKLQIEIIGEANNGIDALALVKGLKPDILITDIRFPGIDGLALAQQVYENDPAINIVIISGYKQFDYAHTALKYGVVEYLVKPINKLDLENVMKKITAKLKKGEAADQEMENLIQQKNMSQLRLRNQFVKDALDKKVLPDTTEVINSSYGFEFRKGEYKALILHIHVKGESYVDRHVIDQVKKTLHESMVHLCTEAHICESDKGIVMLMNYTQTNNPRINKAISGIIRRIREALAFYGRIELTLAVSRAQDLATQYSDALDEVTRLLYAKCCMTDTDTFYAREYTFDEASSLLGESDRMAMALLLEKYDSRGLEKWIQDVFERGGILFRKRPWMAYMGAKEILELFAAFMFGEAGRDEFISDSAAEMMNLSGVQSLTGYLIDIIGSMLQNRYEEKNSRFSQPVRLAQDYMRDNHKDPITVEEVADHVQLSYSYFSTLFRNETGETVKDYLKRIRVDSAKKMLKETTMNLQQVADSVGYSDAKHFSKVFRKVTGISFKDYKRLYS